MSIQSFPRPRPAVRDTASEVRQIEALAALAAAGSADALGLLYEMLNAPLVRDIRRRVPSMVNAEDLAQDTWVKVARSIGTYQALGGGFVSWLFSIGRNRVCDFYAKAGRQVNEVLTPDMLAVSMACPGEGPEAAAERRDFARLLTDCVNRLSPDQRETLCLRMYTGLTIAQTASAMGKTVGAVKVLQHRALLRLAKIMPESSSRLAEYIVAVDSGVRESAPAGAIVRG